jgi:tetratricopeptide (TPR) repeat protein
MNQPQRALIITEPCRGRRAPIEKLVTGTLDETQRPALEAHIRRCSRCRGYRDWIRTHDQATKRVLAAARRHVPDPETVRRKLETHLGRLAATEAAATLTVIATQGFLRRNDPDPTIVCFSRPLRPVTLSAKVQATLAEIQHLPWATAWGGPRLVAALEDMLQDIDPLEDGRALATAASTLALEIDPHCYRAAQIQTRLIREDGYRDRDAFERAIELLLSSDRPVLQADAYGERGARESVTRDPDLAFPVYEKAAEIDPRNSTHAFNTWFYSMLLGEKREQRLRREKFLQNIRSERVSRSRLEQRHRMYAAVLKQARTTGHLTQATHDAAQDILRRLQMEH